MDLFDTSKSESDALKAFVSAYSGDGFAQNQQTWKRLQDERVFTLDELKGISEDSEMFARLIPWLGTRGRLWTALHPGKEMPMDEVNKTQTPYEAVLDKFTKLEASSDMLIGQVKELSVKNAKLEDRLKQECLKSAKLMKQIEHDKVLANYSKLETLPNSWCNPNRAVCLTPVKDLKYAVVHTPCPDGNSCRFLLSQYDPSIVFYGYDHTKPWSVDSVEFKTLVTAAKDQVVGMFDVTLTPPLLRVLAQSAKRVVGHWDHHPTVVQTLLNDPIAPPNVSIRLDLSETKCGAQLTCEWLNAQFPTNSAFSPTASWLRLINLHDTGQFDQLSSTDETVRVGLTSLVMKDPSCLKEFNGLQQWLAMNVECAKLGATLEQQQEAIIVQALKTVEIRVLDTSVAVQRMNQTSAMTDVKDAKDVKADTFFAQLSRKIKDAQNAQANDRFAQLPLKITIAYVDVPDFATPTMIRDRIPDVDVVACRTPASTKDKTAFSFRAPLLSGVNVGLLAQLYGGGGHISAAACTVAGSRYLN